MIKMNANMGKAGNPQNPRVMDNEVTGNDDAEMIMFKCPCGASLKVRLEFAGKKVRCGKCGNILVAPIQEQEQEQPQEPVSDELQQQVADLTQKLEEEQVKFLEALKVKENDIKTLNEEFAKKENGWMSDKKKLSEEIVALKSTMAKEKSVLQGKQNEYEGRISKLSEQLVGIENKLRDVEADKEKNRQEWKEKVVQVIKKYRATIRSSQNQQIQVVEGEFDNLEKELAKTI